MSSTINEGQKNPLQDALQIYSRLFNHKPFLQGEIDHFEKNFQTKRGDREIENIFGILARVSELRDFGVDRLESKLVNSCSDIKASLCQAESVVGRILDAADSNEVEKTLKSGRESREVELSNFSKEIQTSYKKIDENFLNREEELRSKYQRLAAGHDGSSYH